MIGSIQISVQIKTGKFFTPPYKPLLRYDNFEEDKY